MTLKSFIIITFCAIVITLGAVLFLEDNVIDNSLTSHNNNYSSSSQFGQNSHQGSDSNKAIKAMGGTNSNGMVGALGNERTTKPLNKQSGSQDLRRDNISSGLQITGGRYDTRTSNKNTFNTAQAAQRANANNDNDNSIINSNRVNQAETANAANSNSSLLKSISQPQVNKNTPSPQSSANGSESPDASTPPPSDEEDSSPKIVSAGDITGRVLADNGSPATNILVTAVPFDIVPNQGSSARNRLNTNTNEQGYYSFANVASASYRICNKASDTYTRACIQVLPPQKTADIKVKALTLEVLVTGQVLDEQGTPISGASIQVSAQNSIRVNTQSDGSYSLKFLAAEGDNPSIYFQHVDHSRFNTRVFRSKKITENQYEINAKLTRKSGYTVQGTVIDTEGNPVSGQNIGIRKKSGSSNQYGRSNNKGEFTLKNIPAGEDYQAVVITSQDYTYNAETSPQLISVFDDSTNITITLEKKQNSVGELRFFLTSQSLLPVADISLNLTARGKRIGKSTTNQSGEIVFTNVPDGTLSLDSAALPLRVTGIKRDQHSGATITVDKGENEVRISVSGKDNSIVVCQRASISWRVSQDGMSIRSVRNVAIDEQGIIFSSGFGEGDHELSLRSCPKHKNKKQILNIGSQIDFSVVLDPLN